MTAVQNERTLSLCSVAEFAKILGFFILPCLKNKGNWHQTKSSRKLFFFFSGQRRNLSMKNNMQIVNEWERASVSALGPRARWTEACMGDFSYLVWAKRLGKPWNYLVRKPGSSGQGGVRGKEMTFPGFLQCVYRPKVKPGRAGGFSASPPKLREGDQRIEICMQCNRYSNPRHPPPCNREDKSCFLSKLQAKDGRMSQHVIV